MFLMDSTIIIMFLMDCTITIMFLMDCIIIIMFLIDSTIIIMFLMVVQLLCFYWIVNLYFQLEHNKHNLIVFPRKHDNIGFLYRDTLVNILCIKHY